MASGSPGHRTESGAVGSSYQKMVASPQEEPVCLWQPDASSEPISPTGKSQEDASAAALLLCLQHDAMCLRDTPPAVHGPPQPHRSVLWREGAALGSSRSGCHQLYNCLHGWPLTSAFSSFCPSYSPNHLDHLSEILGDWFMGRCWLWVKQCWYFWAGKGNTNNVWGYKQRRQQQLRLDDTEGGSTLSSTQGSFQSWMGMDTHSLPGKAAPVLDYSQSKDCFPYVKAHG